MNSWGLYSKKLQAHIESPKSFGFFKEEDARPRGMRLCVGKQGRIEDGHVLYLYLLVDESDGIIADAKFQMYGSSILIGVADATCEILLRKNHAQAKRLSSDLIIKHLSDKKEAYPFPKEFAPLLNLVIDAIDEAALKCSDTPYEEIHESPPITSDLFESQGIFPGYETMTTPQKLELIEAVMEKEIRPYIELDAGGVKILSLEGSSLNIAYEGSCTSCHSATGSTLNAIQQILRAKIHPELIVVPDPSFLH